MNSARPPRDPDDMGLDELEIGRSDLGLDPDHGDEDLRAERQEAERQRRDEAAQAERERQQFEWQARTSRMRDALRHIASKLER